MGLFSIFKKLFLNDVEEITLDEEKVLVRGADKIIKEVDKSSFGGGGGSGDLQSVMDNGRLWIKDSEDPTTSYLSIDSVLGGDQFIWHGQQTNLVASPNNFNMASGLNADDDAPEHPSIVFSGTPPVDNGKLLFELPNDKPFNFSEFVGKYVLATKDDTNFSSVINNSTDSGNTIAYLEAGNESSIRGIGMIYEEGTDYFETVLQYIGLDVSQINSEGTGGEEGEFYLNAQAASIRLTKFSLDGSIINTQTIKQGSIQLEDNIDGELLYLKILYPPDRGDENFSKTMALKEDIISGKTTFTLDGVETVFTIPHEMGLEPNSMSLTFSDGANIDFIQSARTLDATNITLTCDNVPAAGSITVYWQVFK